MRTFLIFLGLIGSSANALSQNLGTFLSVADKADTIHEVAVSEDKSTLVIRLPGGYAHTYSIRPNTKTKYTDGNSTAEILGDDQVTYVRSGSMPILLTKINGADLQRLRDQARADLEREQARKLEELRIRENAPITRICASQQLGSGYYVNYETYRGTTKLSSDRVGPFSQQEMKDYVSSAACR